MPSLILHIGLPKTGTTSIQHFLGLNSGQMKSDNIFLPSFLGNTKGNKYNHRWASFIASNPMINCEFALSYELLDLKSRKLAKEKKISELIENVKSFPHHHWIITSEHIHSRLDSEEEISTLYKILSPLFERIKIIIYLRKPIDLAISLWSEAIRCGKSFPKLPLPSENPRYNHICNHQRTIQRWSTFFGNSSVIPRLFQVQSFTKGDLLYDFCDIAEIKYKESFQHIVCKNQALNFQQIKFLSYINTMEIPNKNLLKKKILTHFSNLPRYYPTTKEQEIYDLRFKDSDEWVRKNYFPSQRELWLEKKTFKESHNFKYQFNTYLSKEDKGLINNFKEQVDRELMHQSNIFAQ